ncbi:hypothetical protein IJ670_03790, partial [bacterium]|nr:hypothetical protein [bacterium]
MTLNEHMLSLEFDKVLLNLARFACSDISKKACLNLELSNNPKKVNLELSLVDEAKKIIDDTQNSIPIENIFDVGEIFKNSTFNTEEIISLAKSLKCARLAKNFINSQEKEKLKTLSSNLYCNKPLEDEVFDIFDYDLTIKDTASDALKSLRNSLKDTKANLKNQINQLLQNPSFQDCLQDNIVTTREGRTVFQIKASAKNKVPGIVHD